MADLAEFERHILPFVANAPLPAVEDAVLDACIEFATRTHALRAVLDPITLAPNMPEYELEPPDGENRIVAVMAAWLPEGEIRSYTRALLDARYPQGWVGIKVADTRSVTGFYCARPGLLRLVPMLGKKVPKALTVDVAYAPLRTASTVDDLLLEQYAEVIAAGALARLHQHPDAKYADPSRVQAYRSAFDEAMHIHADDSQRGASYRPLRTGGDAL